MGRVRPDSIVSAGNKTYDTFLDKMADQAHISTVDIY